MPELTLNWNVGEEAGGVEAVHGRFDVVAGEGLAGGEAAEGEELLLRLRGAGEADGSGDDGLSEGAGMVRSAGEKEQVASGSFMLGLRIQRVTGAEMGV